MLKWDKPNFGCSPPPAVPHLLAVIAAGQHGTVLPVVEIQPLLCEAFISFATENAEAVGEGEQGKDGKVVSRPGPNLTLDPPGSTRLEMALQP